MAALGAGAAGWVEAVWYGTGVGARAARALLAPWSWAYGHVAAARGARLARIAGDDGHRVPGALPALSVGNLTVGGTGKTPVASWATAELLRRGARPAILLRGYGEDEWRVHERLTPGVPVLVGADRRASSRVAAARGCDCVVMDDAFQHRQAPRVADWVLVSADRWPAIPRLLPAGPFREPLAALRRATVIVVTAKGASAARVGVVTQALQAAAPDVPVAVVRLRVERLHQVAGAGAGAGGEGQVMRPDAMGAVVVVSAIGDPAAFEGQVEALGLRMHARARYRDHHAYTRADLDRLVQSGAACDGVVCTLKDAVKLAPRWPATAAPLWYVSQTVQVETGRDALVHSVDRVLAARTGTVPTAG